MKPPHACLWFDGRAEEAARFYASVFPRSKVGRILRYGPAASKSSGLPEGSVLTVEFELDGRPFMALNGGPAFRFSEAVSFVVPCKDQEEIDAYWAKLSQGGEESACGWLKDKFGLSWQVFPTRLLDMLADRDAAAAERAMTAMLSMRKIDLPTLEKAFAGR
jgi:predicted 3-demethylubiquinone-9 3-methyltransferase (glyoxalase superfamily)